MEPVLIVLIPGVLGGIILAALIAGKRITLRTDRVDRQLEPASPSLINMAHIPVKGGGGLGIVAAVILVALVDPRLRLAMAIAALDPSAAHGSSSTTPYSAAQLRKRRAAPGNPACMVENPMTPPSRSRRCHSSSPSETGM
jgi:hypothetical protein